MLLGLKDIVVVCISIMGILNKSVGVVVLLFFFVIVFSDIVNFSFEVLV